MAEATTNKTPENIPLGSGKLFCTDLAESMEFTDAGLATLIRTYCKDEYELGYISGGASLDYKPSFYTAKDDLGRSVREVITEEESTFKTGIITWNAAVLNRLCETGVLSEDTTNGINILRIGGVGNAKNKNYLFIFYHEDHEIGSTWTIITGKNEGEMSLEYAADKETTIDAEITAKPLDKKGTQIVFIEEQSPDSFKMEVSQS